jgi:hypothetical protein
MENNQILIELINMGCKIINRTDNTWDNRITCVDCLEMPSWSKAWKCNKGLPIEKDLKFRCPSFNGKKIVPAAQINANFWD